MNLLNHLTIQTRMILSYALITVFFVLFGVIDISQINTLAQLTKTLYDHPLKVSNASLRAKAGVISMHRHMKDVSTADSQAAIAIAIEKVQDEETVVYQELATISHLILGDEGKKMVEDTVDLFTGWRPIRARVQAFVLQGDRESANRITKETGADYVARLEAKISELTAYALYKADGFMADANRAKRDILKSVFIFTGLLIVTTLAISALISSSILSSITRLQTTMTRITETGKLEKADISGKNEITLMAGHFNGLINQLKEQFWFGEGRNSLNRILSGNLSREEILNRSLEFLCRYTKACAGAMYDYHAEQDTCELSASWAVVEKKAFAPKFRMGEGIVGQVAKENQALLFNDIPSEEAVAASATLSQPPSAIYAVPLQYETTFFGVLEIAALHPIKKSTQEFLLSAVKTIALILHTADQNKQIQTLLDTTQDANERLQVQTEELQVQTEELQVQTEELQVLNREIQHQSDELKEQNIELEIQRQQVEEATRLKSEFLSNMSHELRTPLNSVNALSRVLILQAGEKLSSEEVNYLEIIERNGKHLLSLINDILDLSKIEAGRMDVQVVSFSIKTLVENVVENIMPLADEKQIRVKKFIPDNLPKIESDESRVVQILQNIVANAIKFTDEGSVTIRIKKQNTDLNIRVTDTGIGITQTDLETIFEEFRQADGASTRKFEGTGLGLSIAYKAAKLLGGDIRVKSTIKKGSEFTVTLPMKYTGSQKQTRVFDRQIPNPGKPDRQTGRAILIVDDDPLDLADISSAFTAQGFDTLTADSGKKAVELAEKHLPFAITLDVIMPEMDGWEVLNRLKENPKTAGIPVIIISASDEQDTGFALGAVGYVTKPVQKKDLIKEINNVYGQPPSSVLVVDDDDIDRNRTTRIITAEGITAYTATGGPSCLKFLKTRRPDLLILDLVMPEMDGFELLERIKKNPDTADIPVIVITAKDLNSEEKKRLEKQVCAILIKSDSNEDQMVAEIRTILAGIGKKGRVLNEMQIKTDNRILLVEDNEAVLIQVKKAMETVGLTVDVAMDGQQALEYVQQTLPKGIILDLMMPRIDGFQVLETIRSTPLTRHIPVLILTAKDLTKRDLKRLSSNNIQQLIQKGDVNKDELLAKVKQMIGIADGNDFEEKRDADEPEAPHSKISSDRLPIGQDGDIAGNQNRPRTILVIEDNPDNLITIKALIPKEFKIIEAMDGETGLSQALESLPDLIFLDISLPKMDGYAVVKKLKQTRQTREIPVVALTAQAMKGDREKILAAGCDDYIAKPIETDRIEERLHQWIGRSK